MHVNRPLDLGSEDVPMVARDQILGIVKQSGPNLMQFGYNTRVFQVRTAMGRARRTRGLIVTDVPGRTGCAPEGGRQARGGNAAGPIRKPGSSRTVPGRAHLSIAPAVDPLELREDMLANAYHFSSASPISVDCGSSGEIEVCQGRLAAL